MKPIACEKAFTCLTKTSTREAAWGNSYKQTAPTLTPSVYMMWFLLRNKSRQFLEPGWFGGGGRGRIGEGKEVVSMATGGGRAGRLFSEQHPSAPASTFACCFLLVSGPESVVTCLRLAAAAPGSQIFTPSSTGVPLPDTAGH